MLCNRNYRGAKHRYLILMYLTCFILSLSPTISAPPERGFSQGQPEMHQSMDNMVAHGVLVKKAGLNFAATDGTGYPAMLTSKTSHLLDEAERVLSTLDSKDSKEKQWIASFVQRMRGIAEMLEKTAEISKRSSEDLNSMSGTPVPEGLPAQPTWTAASAVPGSNPFQKPSKMMSKFSVTSPELNQVLPANENPSESQVVTKPATLSDKQDVEDDELVRELESLHKEVPFEVPVQNSKVHDLTPIFTSPATPVVSEKMDDGKNNVESNKDELRVKLLDEIAQYQQLGGLIPEEIINALNKEKEVTTDIMYAHKPKTEENSKSENADGIVEKIATDRLDDLKNEDKEISKTNQEGMNLDKNKSNQEEKQLQQMNINYPNMPSFPKFLNPFQYMPSKMNEPYQRSFVNAAGNLYKPNPLHFHGNYQAIGSTNQQLVHIPDALKQRMPKPQDRVYNGQSANFRYNEYLAKTRYNPYPYMPHWEIKNSSHNVPPSTSQYLTKPLVNHQIDTQLSEEMKRQLRDGKIVVLSDSVVRANFESDQDKTTENKNSKPKQLDIMDGTKNSTQAPN